MNLRRHPGWFFAMAALALTASGCAGDAERPLVDESQQVAAGDALVLDVPPGSPEVTARQVDTVPDRLGPDLEVIAAFELEPDGARFDPPVTATLSFPGEAIEPSFLLLEAEGGWSLPPQHMERRGDEVVLVAAIDHFSGAAVARPAPEDRPQVSNVQFEPASFETTVGSEQRVIATYRLDSDPPVERLLRAGVGLRIREDSIDVLTSRRGDLRTLDAIVTCIGPGTGHYVYRVPATDLFDPVPEFGFDVDGEMIEEGLDGWSILLSGEATCTMPPESTTTTSQESTTTMAPEDGMWSSDAVDDCTVQRLHDPAKCEPGVDITRFEITVEGGTIEAVIQLASPPEADDSSQWFSDLYIEQDGRGFGCGIGNTDERGTTSDTLAPYDFDLQGSGDLPPGACDATFGTADDVPTLTFRFDLAAATGTVPGPDTILGVSTFRGTTEGASSTDRAFDGVAGVDDFGLVTLEDLCEQTSQTGACTE